VLNQLNTPNNEGYVYEIISGERRWRAFNQLGYQEIPALIKNVDDSRLAVLALIENLQRENLNCMEESKAMHRLVSEFKLTHEEVANQIGKSRTYVTNLMRLQQLIDGVQLMVEQKKIDMGHARCLISLDAASQLILANKIYSQGLSVRQSEEAVKEWQTKQQIHKVNIISKIQPKEWQAIEEQLSQKLGMRCQIEHQKNGKGKVSFEYRSLQEFEAFNEALQKFFK
jgi:ParB family chromosome partitioning protein